jgi:hypothetical protein
MEKRGVVKYDGIFGFIFSSYPVVMAMLVILKLQLGNRNTNTNKREEERLTG